MQAQIKNIQDLSYDIRYQFATIMYEEEHGADSFSQLTDEEQVGYVLNDHFIMQYLYGIEDGSRSALPVFSKELKSRLDALHIQTMKDLTDDKYMLISKAVCIGLFYNEETYILVTGGVKVDGRYMFNMLTLLRSDYAPFMYNEPSLFMNPLCSERELYYMLEDKSYDGTLTVSELIQDLENRDLIRFARPCEE